MQIIRLIGTDVVVHLAHIKAVDRKPFSHFGDDAASFIYFIQTPRFRPGGAANFQAVARTDNNFHLASSSQILVKCSTSCGCSITATFSPATWISVRVP